MRQQMELWRVALILADLARPIALDYFRQNNQNIKNKIINGFDPVTLADRKIEQQMRSTLADLRPDDGILGEEFSAKISCSGLTWVIDPIDGTRGFISGTPTWGVLIAVFDGKKPILGIIDQPFTGERFCGGLGVAEMQQGCKVIPLQTRQTRQLSDAILFSTFPEIGMPYEKIHFDRIARDCKLVRYGMDCYAYAMLAAGWIDLVIETGLKSYDVQAVIAVIEAAGGVVTNWHNAPAHNGGQIVAACNQKLHNEVMKYLLVN